MGGTAALAGLAACGPPFRDAQDDIVLDGAAIDRVIAGATRFPEVLQRVYEGIRFDLPSNNLRGQLTLVDRCASWVPPPRPSADG